MMRTYDRTQKSQCFEDVDSKKLNKIKSKQGNQIKPLTS